MNQQPLEIYNEDCIAGYSLKLLNRAYSGPLFKAYRSGDQEAEVLVYPDADGVTSLLSPVEVISGSSEATTLGSFLCQDGHTNDSVFEEGTSPLVTCTVLTMFDQGSNLANLTADLATAPFLCLNGSTYSSEWGLALNMDDTKKFTGNTLTEPFTAHYRVQFPDSSTTKYFYRQSDDALYAKITGMYIDESVGSASTLVFLNEDYYSNYTTDNISFNEDQGYLITLEVDVTDNVIDDPITFTIENLGLFHTALFYEDIEKHVRRHKTNQMLSEDIELLQQKLLKFSPQSFYNLFYGAKAVFGMFSFAGVLGEDGVKLLRVVREYGLNFTVYADVYSNDSGYIDLDSPVNNITGPNNTSFKNSNTLGEYLAHPDYGDPDNLGESDCFVYRWYSQSQQSSGEIYAEHQAFAQAPRIYNSSSRELDLSSDDGICGMQFNLPFNSTDRYLNINDPIDAKSVILVYQNNTPSGTGISGLTSSSLNQGVAVFAKNDFFNTDDNFQSGVGIWDLYNYRGSTAGLNTDLNTVGIHLDPNNQVLVVNNQEYDITGIDTGGVPGYESGRPFRTLGGSFSYGLEGRLFAAIYYEDDRYSQKQEIQDYMNILFGIQNIPNVAPLENPYIASTNKGTVKNVDSSGQEDPTVDPFQFDVDIPAGTEANDLLLVAIMHDSPLGNGDPGTLPTGWTEYLNINTPVSIGYTIYYKVADGNEPDAVQFEIDNPEANIEECIWWCLRIKGAATSGTIISHSTPAYSQDSKTVTAAGISKNSGEIPLALAFAGTDTGYAGAWNLLGDGWPVSPTSKQYEDLSDADGISAAWAYKMISPTATTTEDVDFTAFIANSANYEDVVGFQLLIHAPAE